MRSISTLQKGVTVSALSAFAFAAGAVFVRFAYQAGVLPGAAIFLRFGIAAVVLVLLVNLSGYWKPLPLNRVIPIFLLGFLGFTILGITFFEALSLTPAWLVALIAALYPLLTNLGSWLFLKEPINRGQVIALVAVLVGAVFLFLQPFERVAWGGILLMCLNILTVAVYLLVGQRWTQGVPPMVSAVWIITGAAVGTLIYALVINELTLSFAPIGWLWVFCFAVISTAFGIMTQWWGVGLIGAAKASIIGSFEPLGTVILAVLLLGEQLTMLQLVGGIFILTGVFLIQYRSSSAASL